MKSENIDSRILTVKNFLKLNDPNRTFREHCELETPPILKDSQKLNKAFGFKKVIEFLKSDKNYLALDFTARDLLIFLKIADSIDGPPLDIIAKRVHSLDEESKVWIDNSRMDNIYAFFSRKDIDELGIEAVSSIQVEYGYVSWVLQQKAYLTAVIAQVIVEKNVDVGLELIERLSGLNNKINQYFRKRDADLECLEIGELFTRFAYEVLTSEYPFEWTLHMSEHFAKINEILE